MRREPVARQRLRLLNRINRRYQTVRQSIPVGALQLDFTRIADADRVLDEVAAEEDRLERHSGRRTPSDLLHLPYWAELWDSALGVAMYLERCGLTAAGGDRRPPRVLDLGCGMGLSGVTAAALGAEVTFADLESPPLLFARLNSLPWRRQIHVRRLDWRNDRFSVPFDLIIGSDILYERTQWEFLDRFWRDHLAAGGAVLLGEPGRQTGDGFIAWTASLNFWKLKENTQPVPTRPRPIRLLSLRRNGAMTGSA